MTLSKNEIFSRLHQLPSMPQVVQEIMASLQNNELDIGVLESMIMRDQGLSAKVLRMANSPFYGLPRNVASVQDATVVLGINCVRSLVLAIGFAHAFPVVPGSLFDRNEYWQRSFRVAGYAKAVAQGLHQEPQMAFTAGLFYEVGQLLLDACIPDQFSQVLQQQKTSALSLVEIERSQWDFDHALIGAEMARRWSFPGEIEHAIHYWRTPEQEPFQPIAGLIHAAVLLESGLRAEDFIEELPGTLRHKLQINWKSIAACMPDPNQLAEEASLMVAS